MKHIKRPITHPQFVNSLYQLTAAFLCSMMVMSANADDSRFIIQVDEANKGLVKALSKRAGGRLKLEARGFFAAEFPGRSLNDVRGLVNNPHVISIEEDFRRFPMGFADEGANPASFNCVFALDVAIAWDVALAGEIRRSLLVAPGEGVATAPASAAVYTTTAVGVAAGAGAVTPGAGAAAAGAAAAASSGGVLDPNMPRATSTGSMDTNFAAPFTLSHIPSVGFGTGTNAS